MSEANSNLSSAPNISDILSTLLSSPESISKISEVISKYTSSQNQALHYKKD